MISKKSIKALCWNTFYQKSKNPNLKKEQNLIQEYMSTKREYLKRNNQRFSDTDLIKKIIEFKNDFNSRKLLTYFRENQVACAEERFRGLYKQALNSSEGTK